jgi:hypothetical protein
MEQKVGFTLLGLNTEQFATFEDNFSEKKKSNLTTGLEFKISKEKKQIGVYVTFTFEQTKKAFLKIQVSCHFGVAPESWDKFCSGSTIVFPKGFISHITMLTVGSARGVLHAKTDGTIFNKFLLPVIDVTAMINEDAVFPLT